MTSFDMLSIPTRGSWFQTNPLEHGLNDHAGNTVFSVCVANGKDMALQRQIWSRFVTALWFRKTEFQTGLGDRFLWQSCELWFPKFTDNLALFLQKYIWKQLNFLPHSNIVKKNGTFCLLWNQCQWKRDVCIHYDVSLYQRIYTHQTKRTIISGTRFRIRVVSKYLNYY